MVSSRWCAADWAGLPPNVCEQILCYDMETFFVGGAVCKAWHNVISPEGCGPVHMDIGYDAYPEEMKFDAKVPNERPFVQKMLEDHASSILESLCLCLEYEDIDQHLPLLSQCHALKWMAARSSALTNWHALDNIAASLQYLEVDTLHMDVYGIGGAEGPTSEYNLVVFNQFHCLEELKLQFAQVQCMGDGWRNNVVFPILGDLHLPCLTSLDLTDTHLGNKLVAPELTFTGIPEACCIQCNFVLPQTVASKRLGRNLTL